jgi:DNA (cytosine-5)-methyltransferase 1
MNEATVDCLTPWAEMGEAMRVYTPKKNSPPMKFHTHIIMIGNCLRKLTPLETERLQGFPDNWTQGHSDLTRYQQTGNAVAVPIAQWIINRMIAE